MRHRASTRCRFPANRSRRAGSAGRAGAVRPHAGQRRRRAAGAEPGACRSFRSGARLHRQLRDRGNPARPLQLETAGCRWHRRHGAAGGCWKRSWRPWWTTRSAFRPPGDRIAVRLEARDSQAIVTVEDDGPGIAPDTLARIFDRYYTHRPSRPVQPRSCRRHAAFRHRALAGPAERPVHRRRDHRHQPATAWPAHNGDRARGKAIAAIANADHPYTYPASRERSSAKRRG